MASTVFEPRRPVAFSFYGLSLFTLAGKYPVSQKPRVALSFAKFISTIKVMVVDLIEMQN